MPRPLLSLCPASSASVSPLYHQLFVPLPWGQVSVPVPSSWTLGPASVRRAWGRGGPGSLPGCVTVRLSVCASPAVALSRQRLSRATTPPSSWSASPSSPPGPGEVRPWPCLRSLPHGGCRRRSIYLGGPRPTPSPSPWPWTSITAAATPAAHLSPPQAAPFLPPHQAIIPLAMAQQRPPGGPSLAGGGDGQSPGAVPPPKVLPSSSSPPVSSLTAFLSLLSESTFFFFVPSCSLGLLSQPPPPLPWAPPFSVPSCLWPPLPHPQVTCEAPLCHSSTLCNPWCPCAQGLAHRPRGGSPACALASTSASLLLPRVCLSLWASTLCLLLSVLLSLSLQPPWPSCLLLWPFAPPPLASSPPVLQPPLLTPAAPFTPSPSTPSLHLPGRGLQRESQGQGGQGTGRGDS